MNIYKCSSSNEPSIKDKLIKNGAIFPELFFDEEEFFRIIIKTFPNPCDSIISLPLCNTLLAEVFNADIDYGDNNMEPYIKSYRYEKLRDIKKNIDTLSTDRIRNILNISKKLSERGYIVSFNIDGPITILASLINPMKLFKAFKKESEELSELIDSLNSIIIEFGHNVINTGAKIISYSDSSGTIDLIGPELFKRFCLESNILIIKSLESELSDKKAIIHICGKSTYSLYASNRIDIIPHKTNESKYKDALIKTIESGKFKIIGNSCLGRINLKPFNSEIYEIRFNKNK